MRGQTVLRALRDNDKDTTRKQKIWLGKAIREIEEHLQDVEPRLKATVKPFVYYLGERVFLHNIDRYKEELKAYKAYLVILKTSAVLKVVKEKNFILNAKTQLILDCVRFWNIEGSFWYSEEDTKMQIDDYLLQMILNDSKTNQKGFEVGRTRSHVWVHYNGERIIMIHV